MRASRLSCPARSLLALAALALVLAPLRVAGRAHCGHQAGEAVGAVLEHHTAPAPHHRAAPAKDTPPASECPHCPIEQCATQVACAPQLGEAATPAWTAARSRAEPAKQALFLVHAVTRGLPPPTPPPQDAA